MRVKTFLCGSLSLGQLFFWSCLRTVSRALLLDPTYASYTIWRSPDPYFAPDPPAHATVVPPPNHFDDPTALGNPAQNHYYLIEGVPASGSPLSSRRKGEFDFALVAGS